MRKLFLLVLLHSFQVSLVAQDTEKDSIATVVNDLNNTAKSYWRTDQEQGLVIAKQALKISTTHSLEKEQFNAYKNVGALFLFSGNYDSAFFYWDQGRLLAEMRNDTLEVISAYNNLAIAAQRSENYTLSLALNRRALLAKLELNDTSQIAISYNNIGILYEELQEFENAQKNYLDAIHLRKILQDSAGLSSTYLNIGSLYLTNQQYDSAENSLNRSISLKKKLNDKWGLANAYTLLGQVKFNRKLFAEAKSIYLRALKLAKELNHEILKTETRIELTETLIAEGSLNQAENTIDLINFKNLEEAPIKSQLKYYQLFARINRAKGNLDQAYQSLQNYTDLKDSLNRVLSNQSLTRERNKLYYESRAKEQKLENQLEKEQLLSASNRKISQITILSVTGFFLLAFSFSYFIFRKRKKELERDIEIRKTMMRELQHRVKNHLQFVNNVLFIEKTLDEKNSEFIDKTSAKIALITKIYDQLLLSSKEDLISIKPYLETLVNDLLSLETGDTRLASNIESIELQSEKVLVLGLIVNEAITNSIKYARTNGELIINISAVKQKKDVILEISDNGDGFVPAGSQQSSGLYLINMLAEQLKSKYELRTEDGVTHSFRFEV